MDFDLKAEAGANGDIAIHVKASGNGSHSFALRAENLAGDLSIKRLNLAPGNGGALTWRARILSANQPWVAVVVPDGDLGRSREVVRLTH